jgi:hypothetical protein
MKTQIREKIGSIAFLLEHTSNNNNSWQLMTCISFAKLAKSDDHAQLNGGSFDMA